MTHASDRLAGYKLIEQGTLVHFDIADTQTGASADGDEMLARIDMHLGEEEEDDFRTEDCLTSTTFSHRRQLRFTILLRSVAELPGDPCLPAWALPQRSGAQRRAAERREGLSVVKSVWLWAGGLQVV